MQHVEFFHRDHFEYRYHRRKVKKALSHFIEFFWETDFDPLWKHHPEGFSDALFPNIGYTYMINLGTPFVMQLENTKYEVRSDTFLPRHKTMICHHTIGNRIFGIKFKVSPIIFEKKVNFSEYKEHLYPLAYLIDRTIIERIKTADSFEKRVEIISTYYNRIIEKYSGSMKGVEVVTQILKDRSDATDFSTSVESLSQTYGISSRTLQRYFEAATSISSKQALQILRIRKALDHITTDSATFHYSLYGYYDYSHFYKHLKGFISQHTIAILQPHLHLLKGSTPI